MRSTSSAGTSSRKRDGSVDWYSPNTRRRAALVRKSRRSAPGHPDVEEPALLLHFVFVFRRSRVRKEPLFHAGDEDDRELQSLGGVHGHQPHAGVPAARLLVDFREQREPIDEAAERGFGIARLVVARRRDQFHQVLGALVGLFGVLLAQIVAGSRTDPASCRARSRRYRSPRRAPDRAMRSRKTRSELTARLPSFASSTAKTSRAQSERADADLGEARREQRRRVGGDRVGIERLERIHDALADPAGRHVDDPPQADVVVRVDDEFEVGERVLDFLALVEADAADDLVRDRLSRMSGSSIARDWALVR